MSRLGDLARCRILTPDPPLSASEAEQLVGALDKLFAQFAREDRLTHWSCSAEHGGAAIVLAWEPDAALSGCSHDKLNRLFANHEERTGRQILAPPPFCVQLGGAWRCLDRSGLRAQAVAATPFIDARVGSLGEWRARGLTSVGASWAGRLLGVPPQAPSLS